MDIIVCVKRVPFTQEVDLEPDQSKKDIRKDNLAYVINDWDNYAIEEAVQLKEKMGGSVKALTVGAEDDEEVLRRALAMGADKAIRIDPGDRVLDPFIISRVIAAAIKDLKFDLILTGVQADDTNEAMVGVMIAETLGIAHASVVNATDPQPDKLNIKVELEGGIDEVSCIKLPALLTIQTGINEPRYVSIMGIRKARKKELKVIRFDDLDIAQDDLKPHIAIEKMYLPPETAGAEILEGDPGRIAEEIIRIIREKGVNV